MYKLMATQEISAKFSVKNEKLNKTSDGDLKAYQVPFSQVDK